MDATWGDYPDRRRARELKIIDVVKENREDLNVFLNTDLILTNYDKIVSDPDIKSHFLWKIYNFAKWKKMYGVD